jgi:hypothetical protein
MALGQWCVPSPWLVLVLMVGALTPGDGHALGVNHQPPPAISPG